MINRIQLIARTLLGGVLALALLGVAATFGLAVVGIVAALLLARLIVELITRVATEHRSPEVIRVINPSTSNA